MNITVGVAVENGRLYFLKDIDAGQFIGQPSADHKLSMLLNPLLLSTDECKMQNNNAHQFNP